MRNGSGRRLLLALLLGGAPGCATTSAPPPEASKASPGTPLAAEPPPSLALLEALLEARAARSAERAWRCWTSEGCWSGDDEALLSGERAAAEEVLRASWRGDARAALLLRAAARLLLEEATRAAALEEQRALAEEVLWDKEAPFALPDLPALLAEAAPEDRPRLLASAAPLVEARSARAVRAEQAREEAARAVGLDEPALLALRVGLEPGELARLARRVLDDTDATLRALPYGPADVPALARQVRLDLDAASADRGAVVEGIRAGSVAARAAPMPACFLVEPPNDVRFAGDERGHPAATRFAKGCVAAGRWHPVGEPVDPLWVQAVSIAFRDSAWLSPRAAKDPDALARAAASRLLEERRAAVDVLALLEGASSSGGALDALATRWAAPGRRTAPGAAVLLLLPPDGASVDTLVAHEVARRIERELVAQVGGEWARGPSEPVARVLVELSTRWRREGPRGFLEDADRP